MDINIKQIQIMNWDWCGRDYLDYIDADQQTIVQQKQQSKLTEHKKVNENRISLKHKKPNKNQFNNFTNKNRFQRVLYPQPFEDNRRTANFQQYPIRAKPEQYRSRYQPTIIAQKQFHNKNINIKYNHRHPISHLTSPIYQQNIIKQPIIANEGNIYRTFSKAQLPKQSFQKSSFNTMNNRTTTPSQIMASNLEQCSFGKNIQSFNRQRPVCISNIYIRQNQQNIYDENNQEQYHYNLKEVQSRESDDQSRQQYSQNQSSDYNYNEGQDIGEWVDNNRKLGMNKSLQLKVPPRSRRLTLHTITDCKKTSSIPDSQESDAFSEVLLSHRDFISNRCSDPTEKDRIQMDFGDQDKLMNNVYIGKKEILPRQSHL